MMYPRLKLSRALLRDDGILIVSISDTEIHNLRLCLDEIFGSSNLLSCVVWNSTKSVTNTALISVSHTHNLIYARNREYFVGNRNHFRLPETGDGFSNPDDDPRGTWKADPFQVGGERPNQLYPITNPNTGETYRPSAGNSWKNEKKTFDKLLEENRIVYGANGQAGPQRKRFQSEAIERGKVANTWWSDLDTTTNATKSLKSLMGASVFDNPKPVSLIRRFIQLGVHEAASESIVLDFFAGSGTTGHAVVEQNVCDGGNRRFVLVQLPEALDSKVTEQNMALQFCDRNDKRRNVAGLTKERLRRVVKKTREKSPNYSGDLEFRVFKLEASNIRAWDSRPDDLEGSLLSALDHVVPGRTEQDILYELILKLGLDLCVPIETRLIADKFVHSAGAGTLMACLDGSIFCEDVEPLALGMADWHDALCDAHSPSGGSTMVFLDSAFEDDVAKVSLSETLRQRGLGNIRCL